MTTIAYRSGIMASDSRVTEDTFIAMSNYPKIHKLKDGSIVGSCGSLSQITDLLAELKKESKFNSKKTYSYEDVGCLVVTPNKELWYYSHEMDHFIQLHGCEHYAIGSGAHFALGALSMGATAKQAVEIAITYDAGSGGKIQTLSV